VVNPTRTPRQAVITLSDRYGRFSKAKDMGQQKTPAATGRTIQAPLEDRNVAVIRLE